MKPPAAIVYGNGWEVQCTVFYDPQQIAMQASLTELVQAWRDFWPKMLSLPHPSP